MLLTLFSGLLSGFYLIVSDSFLPSVCFRRKILNYYRMNGWLLHCSGLQNRTIVKVKMTCSWILRILMDSMTCMYSREQKTCSCYSMTVKVSKSEMLKKNSWALYRLSVGLLIYNCCCSSLHCWNYSWVYTSFLVLYS